MCGLVYLSEQQVWRHLANHPQLQMANDIADALAGGAPVASVVPSVWVDFGHSLAPFIIVLSDSGSIIASSGRLSGRLRAVPVGVLAHVRDHGEERVTWQPERGVRIAAVVVRTPTQPGRFVVVGRSLRETEAGIAQHGRIVALAWIISLVGLFVVTAMTARWS